MSFGILALVVLAGLAGPALAAGRRAYVPVVVGEILAGIAVGRTGFGAVDPGDPTTALLADVGFAMLMLTVGMHVPLRKRRLLPSLRRGAAAAGVGALAAPLGGLAAAAVADTGHPAIYAVLLASGSAAVVGPMLEERHLRGADAMVVLAQVTLADVVAIVAVPIVLQPARAGNAALGAALVTLAALAAFGIARAMRGRAWVHALRKRSKRRRWALDLRLSLVSLFALAWLAQKSGTSVLFAGLGAGLTVAAIGGPKRLSAQVHGVAQGFFVPLFFVVLGARLDLRGVVRDPGILRLAVALLVCNVVIRAVSAAVTRQHGAAGLMAAAQLGVPAALVTIGLKERVIAAPEATAIILAALASLGASALGALWLGREKRADTPAADTPAPSAAQASES